MAYKFSRDEREFGDIKFESDSDTGLDFEENYIGFDTDGSTSMVLSGSRVGIGTTTPEYHLQVAGNIGVNQYIYHNGDANTWLNFTDDRIRFKVGGMGMVGMHKKDSAPHQVTINNGNNNIDFVVNSNNNSNDPIMRCDASTARVGIGGVAAPDEALHVGGNLKVVGTNFITGSLQVTGSGQSLITLHTRDADNLKEIVFLKDGNAAAAMQINSAEHFFIENENAKDLILRTNNQNTLRIYGSSQRVGINQPHGSTTANGALDVTGEVMITGSAHIENTIALKQGSDPSTLDGYAHIYAKNDGLFGDAELFVRDEAGNVTKISPHNSQGEWEYFSKNTKTGKVFRVNMEKMIRKLEEITGESFIEEWNEDK